MTRVIYGLSNLKKKIKNAYLTIGIFDGLHLGHQFIIRSTIKKARLHKGRSIVITFWPHPEKEPHLNSLAHRVNLIRELNPHFCIIILFTKNFSLQSPREFIKNIFKKIEIKEIFTGRNFTFGKDAQGNIDLLKKISKEFDFKINIIEPLKINHQSISSTLIRRLIQEGNVALAKKYLGREVSVAGQVIKGDKLGRLLGYPTANIISKHEVMPASGIYVVKVIIGKNKLNGICYIGKRPTFKKNNQQKNNIEVHIFNFKKNIYHKHLEILFLKKIRPDKKFPNKQRLLTQIQRDERKAKEFLKILPQIYHPEY